MLSALIWAVIWIAVVCTVAYVVLWFLKQVPNLPSFIPVIIQVAVAIICLVILVEVFLPSAGVPHPLR